LRGAIIFFFLIIHQYLVEHWSYISSPLQWRYRGLQYRRSNRPNQYILTMLILSLRLCLDPPQLNFSQHLWDLLSDFELQLDIDDKHLFSLASNGKYSAKSSYKGLFLGSSSFAYYKMVWKSWAPPKCRFFIWLVTQKRCWTANRLAKRGLDHSEKCLLCDQEAETMDHLTCVFAREFWYLLLRQFGLQLPRTIDGCFLLPRLVGKGSRSSEWAYQKGSELPHHFGCLSDLESPE
jgi:hypothetical protein